MWISIFGAFSMWMSLYGLNQMALQRYCSLPSLRHARIVIYITVPGGLSLKSTSVILQASISFPSARYNGVLYWSCNVGVLLRRLRSAAASGRGSCQTRSIGHLLCCEDAQYVDERLPMNTIFFAEIVPGLPGFFLACLFSATLSTFSSGMNSQAAVLWEDFLKVVRYNWCQLR